MVVKNVDFNITEQCMMLGIHRSGYYYVHQGESELNLDLMKLIDKYFLEHPHSGVLTLCAYLCLSEGYRQCKADTQINAFDGTYGYVPR